MIAYPLRVLVGLALPLLWLFFCVNLTWAQTFCGSIIFPADPSDPDSEEEVEPIENCEDPFDRSEGIVSPYSFFIDDVAVTEGATVETPIGGSSNYSVEGDPILDDSRHQLFIHDGDDYRFQSMEESKPQEDDYRAFAAEFFPEGTDIEPFIQRIYDRDYEFIDEETEDLYFDFRDYVDENYIPQFPPLTAGTYTLVSNDFQLILSTAPSGAFEKLFSYIVPIAHAQAFQDYVFTLTFEVVEVEPEPLGASSVLFLPGIQGSRLYTEGLFGTENQIWEPNINQDVRQLEMTEAGESINDIYTKEVLDEIYGVQNVYRGFLDFLEELRANEVIKDFEPFAYDWRYDVRDVASMDIAYPSGEIKQLVETINNLASESYTGEVTIIAHSNGGLLAKAVLDTYGETVLEDKIDKIVMVGTPQLGAPKAIAAMLHGYDQQAAGGLIIDDETSREVSRNMPGTYALLPSAKYFEITNDVVITTDNSSITSGISAYGDISNQNDLHNFLLDTQDEREDTVPIHEPSTLNETLLQQAVVTQNVLEAWEAPHGVEIYEIAGTGIVTIKGFEYRSFPCSIFSPGCTYMKIVPILTDQGDETVPVASASGYDEEKVTAFVDLFSEGEQLFVKERSHINITESPTIQDYLESIIHFPYLEETLEIPSDYVEVERSFTIIGAHSPVTMHLTSTDGKRVGVIGEDILQEINGSQYFELGGSSYIVVPYDIDYTVNILGEETGAFSLTIESLVGNAQTPLYAFLGASSTPNMAASFSSVDNEFSTITTDLNGDGSIDLEHTLDGEKIESTSYNYSDLIQEIEELDLAKVPKLLLIVGTKLAEHWNSKLPPKPIFMKRELAALKALEKTLKLYKSKRLISVAEYDNVLVVINYLRDN